MLRTVPAMISAYALAAGLALAQSAPDTAAAGLTGQSQSMGPASADALMGPDVVGSEGVRLGSVADVVLDPEGRAQQIVVAIAPPGAAARQVAIAMATVRTRSDSNALHLAGTSARDLAALPEFAGDGTTRSLARNR